MKSILTQGIRSILVVLLASSLGVLGQVETTTEEVNASDPAGLEERIIQENPTVQLALLLDTSSSMGGLVRQAQTQLWKIVNEFALAKQDGKSVALQVALFEYGKNTLSKKDQYIRKIVPLTDDLDKVSEELFALRANTISGGDEYCGTVIQKAVTSLQWDPSLDELKVIVIAGNESFAQGSIDYREACRGAIAKGIIVNTIYCGPYATGVSSGWREGAQLADGIYANIDQNQAIAYRRAPQDKAIVELGRELNETYLAYGVSGRAGLVRQKQQDANAEKAGAEIVVQRSIAKGSSIYSNTTWDLVDAVEKGDLDLKDVSREKLPQPMLEMDAEEQQVFIESKAKQRREIQTKIEKLHQERREYLAESKPAAVPNQTATLNASEAVVTSRRSQSESRTGQSAQPVARSATTKKLEGNTLQDALSKALKKQAKEKGIDLK